MERSSQGEFSGFCPTGGDVDVGGGGGMGELDGFGVGVKKLQDRRSRLKVKNEAKSLFIDSFRLGSPMLFAGLVPESNHLY